MALGMTDEQFHQMWERLMYPDLPYRSIEKNYDEALNVNSKICAECGGKCCKRCGCHFSPDDFEEISFEYLKKQIEKGYISIDYVDGEMLLETFGVYILRIRNVGVPIVDIGYRRTPCILLTENGCKLDYKQRPSGGKLLIPSEEFTGFIEQRRACHSNYSTKDCCYEWKPHQKILAELSKYFRNIEIPCSL